MYRVLVVTAHPDDMEIYCAGTLLKCLARNDEIYTCHLSSGSLGHVVIPPQELILQRKREAENATRLADFREVCWGGFHDLDIYDNNKAARDKVVEVIKRVNPDFIITHSPNDYMPDHSSTSRLVFDAAFTATLPNYPVRQGEAAKMVPIFYMQTAAGVKFQPTEYVDITDVMELKTKMMECHESQVGWLREHDGMDMCLFAKTANRYFGYQCGAEYAEGFRQCHVYLKGTTKRYLP